MATTCIWMVCNHHPPMCFFYLLCWGALSAMIFKNQQEKVMETIYGTRDIDYRRQKMTDTYNPAYDNDNF